MLDKNNNIKVGVAKAFGEENEIIVTKIIWLSNKDVLKAYGIILVHLTKGSNIRRIIIKGFFYAREESSIIRVFNY